MNEQVEILSVNGYMKKYAVDGIGKGADRWAVKRQMLDQFRREIFNMAVFKLGPQIFSNEWEGNSEDRKKLENILDNANKKWKNLCREFEKYRETAGLIQEDDLQKYLEDRMDIAKGEDEEADDGISTAHLATDEEMAEITGENNDIKEEENNGTEEGTD